MIRAMRTAQAASWTTPTPTWCAAASPTPWPTTRPPRGAAPFLLDWNGGPAGYSPQPTIPRARVLRAAVRRAVADQAGRTDYTYSRPSRRRVPGTVQPAMRGPSVIVSVVVDTSGSMSKDDLDAAMSEVAGVLRSSGVARDPGAGVVL